MFNDKSILKLTVGVLTVFSLLAFTCTAYAGLADKYPGDVGIENDPNVVFTENFEEGSIPAVTARWDSAQNPSLMSLTTDIPETSTGQNSLLITHVQAETTGAHLYTRLLPGYDELYFRFYTKFDTLCNVIHHFVHMGGYNPPTPWPQGGAGIRPTGTDRVSTGIEPHSTWYWDFYAYWMEMRGNPVPDMYWGNSFINDPTFASPKGQWICVEAMMKMNNPTTSHNGELALWVDGEPWYVGGQLASHLGEGFPNGYWIWASFYPDLGSPPYEGFRWRSTEDLKVNWVWLLVYISSELDPGHINKVWFDDVVVATEYIGPISTNPVYSLTVNSGSGDGYYEEYDVVPISADVISGLTFAEWTGDTTGIVNIYAANTTITMPAQDVTITATYTGTQTYLLTVNSGTGDGLYEENQIVPITADPPPPNEEFSHWVVDTAIIADVNLVSTTITMPPLLVTITAIYKPQGTFIETKEFGDATNTDYPGTVEDTWCGAGGNADINKSTSLQLNTYTWPVNNVANTIIIKWDVSAIPPDAMVTEATLYLYQNGSSGDAAYENGVHKIINVNPVISAVTWNTYDGTNSWTGGGLGDIAAAEDTPAVNLTDNEYKTWSVTNMVQDWVTASSTNYGMLVNSDDVASSNSWRYFASTEDAVPSKRPKLIVTYNTAIIGDFEPDGDVDFADFAAFAEHWRDTGCAQINDWCGGADFNHLNDVNIDDLNAMTNNWLVGTE